MLLRSLLFFCALSLVSVNGRSFPIGYRESSTGRTLYTMDDVPRTSYYNYGLPEATAEMEDKEYGKESKQSDQSNKKRYYVSSSDATWTEARNVCDSMGMVLGSPTTPEKNFDLINYLKENLLEPRENWQSGYWIGSHIDSKASPWLWESTGEEVKNFGWYPQEPNLLETEHCMEMIKISSYGWNNLPCDLTRRFICESLSQNHELEKNNLHEVTTDIIHDRKEVDKKKVEFTDSNIESKFDEDDSKPRLSPSNKLGKKSFDEDILSSPMWIHIDKDFERKLASMARETTRVDNNEYLERMPKDVTKDLLQEEIGSNVHILSSPMLPIDNGLQRKLDFLI